MRGEVVDFDLMEIKNKLRQQPTPVSVQQRQNFVDKKIKRRVTKLAEKIAEKELETAAALKEVPVADVVREEPVLKTQTEPQNALKEIVEDNDTSVKETRNPLIDKKRKKRTIKKT